MFARISKVGVFAAALAFGSAASYCEARPADCDGNGCITLADMFCFLNHWSLGDPAADINGDARVDVQDFLAFLSLYASGTGACGGSVVPAPPETAQMSVTLRVVFDSQAVSCGGTITGHVWAEISGVPPAFGGYAGGSFRLRSTAPFFILPTELSTNRVGRPNPPFSTPTASWSAGRRPVTAVIIDDPDDPGQPLLESGGGLRFSSLGAGSTSISYHAVAVNGQFFLTGQNGSGFEVGIEHFQNTQYFQNDPLLFLEFPAYSSLEVFRFQMRCTGCDGTVMVTPEPYYASYYTSTDGATESLGSSSITAVSGSFVCGCSPNGLVNDLCENAVAIGTGAFPGTTTGAGFTMPSPGVTCPPSADVWYVYTPTQPGTLSVDTCSLVCGSSPGFATALSAYTGLCGVSLTEVVSCSANTLCGSQSRMSFAVAPCVPYLIRVGGLGGAVGDFVLSVSQTNAAPAQPSNDEVINAIDFLPRNGTVTLPFTCGATNNPADPLPLGCSAINRDVWYHWIAPCAGLTSVSTCGSGFNTSIAIYYSGLSEVACNDDAVAGPCAGTTQSYATFTASAGDYYIRVGGSGTSCGCGRLTIISPPAPAAPASCPPGGGTPVTRQFKVVGNGIGANWAWCLSAPCCFNASDLNVPGVVGLAPDVVSRFVLSLNAACPGLAAQLASPDDDQFTITAAGCAEFVLSVGPAGTPCSDLCVVADVAGTTSIFTSPGGPCRFNPGMVEEPSPDTEPPVITCPPDVSVDADAGGCSAALSTIEPFDAAPPLSATRAPGVYYTDRFAPAVFTSAALLGRNVLRHGVVAADHQDANTPQNFYNTQGRKLDINMGVGQTLGIDLYIPGAWVSPMPAIARADLWATGLDGVGAVLSFPIIGFTSNDPADPTNPAPASPMPRWRVWDDVNGVWIDLASSPIAGWHRLEITLASATFVFKLDGVVVRTLPNSGTVVMGNAIIQVYNFGQTYDVLWDNLTTGPHPALASATDNADPAPVITYDRREDHLSLTAPYPGGVTHIDWTATDASGNPSSCTQTVTVSGFNQVVAVVELQPAVAAGPFTRCIRFDAFNCSPAVSHSENVPMTFSGGTATATFTVPCGLYTCMTARDPLHTLRRTDEAFHIEGNRYVADFTGDPAGGGDWLPGGNLNGDPYLDILDFGAFIGQYGQHVGASTTCSDTATHSDLTADGLVDFNDFTFIQINFFKTSEANCCGGPLTPGAPRGSVTLAELHAMGLDRLAVADLNRDGVIDGRDIAMFVAHGACPADWNGDGNLDVRDFLVFLTSYSAGDGDWNGDGVGSIADFLGFLGGYAAGCP
jgi:hypothetical protein